MRVKHHNLVERPPTFTRHQDGRLTVDRWTPEILVSMEFLEAPMDPGFLVREGESLYFRVANGSATYRIVSYLTDRREVRAVLGNWRLDVRQ